MLSNSSSGSRRKSEAGDICSKNFDPVLVYCRVRPLQLAGNPSNAVVRDSTTIILASPTNGNGTGNGNSQKNCMDHETHYIFKKVFGPDSTQNEIFKVVAQPLVEKLIKGSSSLLFSYGVTGSGKTYTMTGDSKELGLMPRCLEALFRTIGGFHAQKFVFQPDHLNGFEIVSDSEALARQKVEKHSHTIGQRITQRSSMKQNDTEYELNTLEDIPILPGVDERNVYAVFISYTEVYNNCVYDLLEECSVQRCLQSRIVREDSNRNMYVHGVTEIEIKSVQEAMEAFQIGQKHKKIGHTLLNAESSRSHSIFNIRLVQAPIGEHSRENKEIITVSQLSLVDLAGSERSSRTNNSGARLREAGNINNSLMTLRTCLEYLRENQQTASGNVMKKIPYRDSKITQLFKNFFEGEGQVSMIACIHPRTEDFYENSQVMKFAEVTQEVQIPRASTIQVCSNENDLINLLKTRLSGYDVEIPPGDGPLSEKLISMFQQYMERSKTEARSLMAQCQRYRQEINDLQHENSKLKAKLAEEKLLHTDVDQRNQALEEAVNVQRGSIKTLSERLQNQTSRLDAAEESLNKMLSWEESRELIQQMNIEKSSSIAELLMTTSNTTAPKKINFKLINKFIDLVGRDEL